MTYRDFNSKKVSLYHLKNVDSTNRYVTDNSDKLENYSIVSAETQTMGKGRVNRSWDSSVKGNIYASILLKDLSFQGQDSPIYSITQFAAITIRDILAEIIGSSYELKIKWPNDLILNDKKVCGILSSANFTSNSKADLVIGFGINLQNSREELAKIDKPATSIFTETGISVLPNELLEEIAKRFMLNLDDFLTSGFSHIREVYEANSYTLGKNVTIITPQGEVVGKAIGVNSNGFIKIENNNKINLVNTGDVVW